MVDVVYGLHVLTVVLDYEMPRCLERRRVQLGKCVKTKHTRERFGVGGKADRRVLCVKMGEDRENTGPPVIKTVASNCERDFGTSITVARGTSVYGSEWCRLCWKVAANRSAL